MTVAAYLAGGFFSRLGPATTRRWDDRAFDAANRMAALLIVLALSPLLGVICLWIWRTDGAPILFSHYRVGLKGKLFPCFKFRSMHRDAEARLAALLRTSAPARTEWERDQKLLNDPRVTAVGRLLRRTSLDELPQLLNVLRGDMALVGPRPVTVAELTRYGGTRWHYLSVRPGMTGLWQVSGRNTTTYDERVDLDRSYVEGKTVQMDLGILIRTVKVVLTGHGAR